MKIMIVGLGYVGLVTGACFAEWGHQVIGIDIDENKIDMLKAKKSHIYEPEVEDLLVEYYDRWSFHNNIADGLKEDPEVIFICVGTPSDQKGNHYLYYVFESAREIAKNVKKDNLIVISKSTVPVGTGDEIKRALLTFNPRTKFYVGSNPETLREGSAVSDFNDPDRLIFGADEKVVEDTFFKIYDPLIKKSVPYIMTSIRNAEMIKEVSNFFLALRISATNLIAQMCDNKGSDIKEVMQGVGLDKRIGSDFLNAGLGFGGSCFPKDVKSLLCKLKEDGISTKMVESVIEINQKQRELFLEKVKTALWGQIKDKKIAVWGLSFKPNTDDVREAPSLDIVPALLKEGAKIFAYDPVAIPKFERELKKIIKLDYPAVTFCNDKYEVLKDADALLILTEWSDFQSEEVDFNKMKELMKVPRIIDGRNIFDPKTIRDMGIEYVCIGRP